MKIYFRLHRGGGSRKSTRLAMLRAHLGGTEIVFKAYLNLKLQ